jgi:DNA-binding response OmpR family regulator
MAPSCGNKPSQALTAYVHFCTFLLERILALRDICFRQGVPALEDLIAILVAEDDQAIQTLVEATLEEGGFAPAIAASGEEAITLLQGQKMKYRALVTDINLLGRINGWEAAKRAREIDPTFPIIYMTAVAADDWVSRGVPNSVLLTKPFAPAQLVTALSNLLTNSLTM